MADRVRTRLAASLREGRARFIKMVGGEADGDQKQNDRNHMNPAVLRGVDLVLDIDHIANVTGDVGVVLLSTAARGTDSAHNDLLRI